MARIKPESAYEKTVSDGFCGIRYASALTEDGASVMRNFRIASDGSLEKRCGMTTLYSLSGVIRGVWQGTLNGSNYLMVVAGNAVYVRVPNASAPAVDFYLQTTEGPVCFAVVGGVLYLFDGDDIYRYSTSVNSFSVASGYAPLYGKNWHPTQLGSVNEPRNMISRRIRIRYLNSSAATTINLPFTTASIDRADVDGEIFTDYSFTPQTSVLHIPAARAHGVLTLAITISEAFSQRSIIARTNRGFVYRNAAQETLLLYGGQSGYRVYNSSTVTDEMLSESSAVYYSSDPLYFKSPCGFYLGDQQHPIHAICRDRDRVLALSDQSIWTIEYAGEDLVSYPMEGSVGCSTPGGVALCGSDPVVIHDSGIYKLQFPSGKSDTCVPSSLSDGVSELFSASLFQNGILAWFPEHNELWLRDPTESTEGLVWILSFSRREWYCFNGIPATAFFEIDGKIGFGTSDGRLVFPDSTALTDDGVTVNAFYKSHYIAFSHPENFKRAYRISACADTGGKALSFTVKTDHEERTFTPGPHGLGKPSLFDCRAASGRFRFLRYQIATTGSASTRIYRLSIFANP